MSALPRACLRAAEALAEAVAPPSPAIPERPPDVGFAERFDGWAARLPWDLRLAVGFALLALDWLPVLLLRGGRLSRATAQDREAHLLAWTGSRVAALRIAAKVALLLAAPPYYAAEPIRARLRDETQRRVASPEASRTFPVLRGEAVGEKLDADVVIVGSGAGGSPLAATLAEAGHSVIVLEAGAYRPSYTYPRLAFEALGDLYADAGVTTTVGTPPIVVPVGRVVGGTTLVNSGTCFRIPGFVHAKWADELSMPDALSEASLSPYYETAERDVSVRPVPDAIVGANNDVARRGAEALGWSHGPLSRNEDGCAGSNRCAFGCPRDAKQAMHVSYLPRAVSAGARVIAGVDVRRVRFRGNRAAGVDARTSAGRLHVDAKVTIVSAGTFGTPPLLWRSGLRHRGIGRRLTLHPAVKISGLFPGSDFHAGGGVPQSWCIDEFQERGVMMEGAHVPPDLASVALPGRGRAHKALMERAHEIATYGFLVSDEPSGFMVRGFGRPILRYDLSEADRDKVVFGLERLCELFAAAGAERLYLPSWKLPELAPDADFARALSDARIGAGDLDMAAFHPLGTCGLGVDGQTFPLDTDLAVRDRDGLYVADGSVFPSSLAVNPQMSIMALSLRLAGHLHAEVL